VRHFFAASAATLCMFAGQAAAETFNTTSLRIDNAAAEVMVIPEDRTTIDVQLGAPGRLPALTLRQTADGVVIAGGLRNRIRGCGSWNASGEGVRVSGIGQVRRQDLPRITVRVPRALNYRAGGAVYSTIGASSGGSVTLNGCGDATLAPATGALEVELNGSGGGRIDRVNGTLTATVNGSGSLDVAHAGADAVLRLNGSGSLDVADVVGRLDARAAGSGSLRTGAAGGDARLVLTGSGNVEAGAVNGALDAELRGSGSMRVGSVEGAHARLELTSSGDINVRGGRVGLLDARSAGSGSVRYGGAATTTRAHLTGSGSITIADAGRVEQLIDNGSGSVNVGR
jgi:hypothetical protein